MGALVRLPPPAPAAPDPDFDRLAPDPARSWAPPSGREAVRELLPMQPGDVEATFADVAALEAEVGVAPKIPLEEGIPRFVAWFRAREGL